MYIFPKEMGIFLCLRNFICHSVFLMLLHIFIPLHIFVLLYIFMLYPATNKEYPNCCVLTSRKGVASPD